MVRWDSLHAEAIPRPFAERYVAFVHTRVHIFYPSLWDECVWIREDSRVRVLKIGRHTHRYLVDVSGMKVCGVCMKVTNSFGDKPLPVLYGLIGTAARKSVHHTVAES
jgi:hypothetical protein